MNQNTSQNLETIKEGLIKSPMFQLSLSSKELFHSNFLYWLAISQRTQFPKFLSELIGEEIILGDVWEPKREYKNLDFCIVKDNKIIFALENKFKSIATTDQLKTYNDKIQKEYTAKKYHGLDIKVTKVLLSLTEPLFDTKREELGWISVNYGKLSQDIRKTYLPASKEETYTYQQHIINDYCNYIQQLHNIAQKWKVDKNSSFFAPTEFSTLMQELRIHDCFEKYRFSQMEQLLKEQLSLEQFKTKSGFSRSQGLFELWFDWKGLWIKIQIQQGCYRHAIEGHQSGKNCDALKKWQEICDTYEALADSSWFNCPPIESVKEITDDKKFATSEEGKFNQYDGSNWFFIYQYIKIKPEATIEQLINAMVNDITNIYNKLTKAN